MAASNALLERGEQIGEIKDLFLLNPGNLGFVLGKSPSRAQNASVLAPLLFGVLALLLVAFPLAEALRAGSQSVVYWLLVLVIAVPSGYGVWRAFRKYQEDDRLNREGKLLLASITNASTRERSEAAQTLVSVMQVVGVLVEILSVFSGGSTNSTSGGSNDFYELTIVYKATTPTGGRIEGEGKRNRPDLRATRLPQPGESILLLYVDDTLCKVL
jgi:hypothetical protein